MTARQQDEPTPRCLRRTGHPVCSNADGRAQVRADSRVVTAGDVLHELYDGLAHSISVAKLRVDLCGPFVGVSKVVD